MRALSDAAEAWARSKGVVIPKHGTPAWRALYSEWVDYAFKDMRESGRKLWSYDTDTRACNQRHSMLLSEQKKFGPLVSQWLEAIGVSRVGPYDCAIDTIYGPLRISVYSHSVMTRFDDSTAAMPVTMSHTGKWNHYDFDVPGMVEGQRSTALAFFYHFHSRLTKILKSPPRFTYQSPARIPYDTGQGPASVYLLVTDDHKGFKSYWIEDAKGKKIHKPTFFNMDSVRLIVERAGYVI